MANALNRQAIEGLIAHARTVKGKQFELQDDREAGLRIRAGERSATWLLSTRLRNGKRSRIKLGAWPAMGLSEARHAAQATHTCLVESGPGNPLRNEIDLKRPNVFEPEPLRRPEGVAINFRIGMEIRSLRRGRQVAKVHIVDHTTTQRAYRCRGIGLLVEGWSNNQTFSSGDHSGQYQRQSRFSGFVQSLSIQQQWKNALNRSKVWQRQHPFTSLSRHCRQRWSCR